MVRSREANESAVKWVSKFLPFALNHRGYLEPLVSIIGGAIPRGFSSIGCGTARPRLGWKVQRAGRGSWGHRLVRGCERYGIHIDMGMRLTVLLHWKVRQCNSAIKFLRLSAS